MEYRVLEIKVVSARDLKKVNLFNKMDPYVVVSITGEPKSRQKTTVDREGDTNPTWNFPMKFVVDSSPGHHTRQSVVLTIRCQRGLGDKEIGEVHVPVAELIGAVGIDKWNFLTYQVRKPSGKPKGELNFCYKWGDKVDGVSAPPSYMSATPSYMAAKAEEPVTAYPAPLVGTSSAYPPAYGAAGTAPGPYPPQQYPYGGYPPAGYGYPPPLPPYGYPPPPPPGYGYPPQQVVQQPAQNSRFGLGAGLLGGALGGLLIGDLLSDGGGCGGGCGGGGCGGGF